MYYWFGADGQVLQLCPSCLQILHPYFLLALSLSFLTLKLQYRQSIFSSSFTLSRVPDFLEWFLRRCWKILFPVSLPSPENPTRVSWISITSWTCAIVLPVRRSNQLSYEATDVGGWSFVSSKEPWRMDVKWYMKCFIYWTADFKSSKLWSSQLRTQFKQLRIEAWKSLELTNDQLPTSVAS